MVCVNDSDATFTHVDQSERRSFILSHEVGRGTRSVCVHISHMTRHTVGDTKVPFCLQSCVKPLKYAIAVHDHGTEYVHHFIGKEPSGLRFNKLFLNDEDKPHNPMVNAGAIVCTSLIK
ncbi:glutaminase kidney isoform, mitochondrial-like isoform X1, partial [Tachysurus ichikawai]